MKLSIAVTLTSLLLAFSAANSAPFGSVAIQPPSTQVQTPGVPVNPPPQVRVGAGTLPQKPPVAPPVAQAPLPPQPPQAGSGSAQPQTAVGGQKWVQDSRGARYQVSASATLPPGWMEIAPPAQAPQPQVQYAPAPMAVQAPPPAPGFQQPQIYSGGQQQPVNVPREQVQPPMNYLYAPSPTAPGVRPPSASGLPPGKKRMRHTSGYTVIVSESTIPGPEFTEIESSSAPTAPYQPQAAPGGYGMAPPPRAPVAPQQAPQTYSGVPQQIPQQFPQQAPQQPVYYQQPQTYNSAPQLPNVPPTWQQQLPYQPPQPQYQQPIPGQPYSQQMQQQAPLPVVRKTPQGKKWVADQSGLRYLVSEDVTVMPPMREVSEEELNQPVYIGPQPGQQQQPQGSAVGRFFQGLRNR